MLRGIAYDIMDNEESHLEDEYQNYIQQLSEFHNQNKTNEVQVTLKIIDSIQKRLRDYDIAKAILNLKKNENSPKSK